MTRRPQKRRPYPRTLLTFVLTQGGLRRVKNLLVVYDHAVKTHPDDPSAPASDVLRAAVVLLHATLEEFVRYVAGSALPIVGQDALNDIPLVGAERKATRVGLGAWAIHRGKQVDQVLAESVRAHLVEKSFSSLASVLSTLQASGIPTRRLRIRRATLDRLIRRRHQIVHEADVLRGGSLGARPPRALSRSQLTRWLHAVERFINDVDRLWTVGR